MGATCPSPALVASLPPSLHASPPAPPRHLQPLLSTMAAPVAGTYALVSSENLEELMKAMGVGMIQRKMFSSLKPDVEFAEVGPGEWIMKTISTVKTVELKFKIGEEFTEQTNDVRECKTTFTVEGNKLIQMQKAVKGKDSKVTREFNGDDLITIVECDGVVSKRIYKKK